MSHNGGNRFDPESWYRTLMNKRTRQTIREREAAFEKEYRDASDEALLSAVKQRARELGYTPFPAEVIGAQLICQRFGSWQRVLHAAALDSPRGASKLEHSKLYKAEYLNQQEIYRTEKQEKKEARQQQRARALQDEQRRQELAKIDNIEGAKNMVIHHLPFGDPVYRYDGNIVVRLNGRRKVLSTAMRNGGYREDLKFVYNHDARCSLGVEAKMNGKDIHEHTLNTILSMGLDPEVSAGMETAAHMENASIKTEAWGDYTSVTAIVTGGIETNGGRVGDPGGHIEREDVPREHRLGTINIMLAIDADLSPGCMTRAIVTCTEAKTAAIQELLAPSRYSRGLATGSGTDSTVLIVNADSPRYLTDAGKHSKLGELIGKAVKAAVKEALYLQTGLCPASQHDAFKRLSRFGVTEERFYEFYLRQGGSLERPDFSDRMERITKSGDGVALASTAAHLIDQMDWTLLTGDEAVHAARLMMEGYASGHGVEFIWAGGGAPDACILENWQNLLILEIEK